MPYRSTEHHADVSPAALSARPSQEAREAWERYVQGQWGPMLKALGASGKEAISGQGAAHDMSWMPTPSAAEAGSTDRQAGAKHEQAHVLEYAISQQMCLEENGVWASLAADALQEASDRTAQHVGPSHEPSQTVAPDDGADSDSSEEIDIIGLEPEVAGLESKFGSLCLKHPWDEHAFCSSPAQEPLTFSSVGVAPQLQHQRTRRVVRVVRSAKSAADKTYSAETPTRTAVSEMPAGLKEALLSSPGSSSPEPSSGSKMGRHDPSQRTRKKRAAATLMEGTSTFHAPPTATGEHEGSSSSPPAGPKQPSQGVSPDQAPKQSMQPPPPVAMPSGSAPIAQPSQNRLPHPMDPMPRLHPHACCAPPIWPPPTGHMQHAAAPRYPYTVPSSGIPVRAGALAMESMQETPLPAVQSPCETGKSDKESAASSAMIEGNGTAPQRPPLLLAAALGRTDVIHSLLAATDFSNPAQPFTDHRYTQTHQALEEAAAAAAELARQATGHPNKGAPFLSAPRSPNVPQELTLLHCTALHLAAIYGHAQAVQALLTSPACSPAACNAMGTTALQTAAREGWVEVIAVLAGDPECQVNSIDIAGRTALHWAAAYGHVAVVNELWCRSANVQQIDHGGWTALHYAADAGHSEVAGSLVIAGTLVSAYSAAGWTAAHLAAMKGHTPVIEKLLIGGYQIDTISQYPNSGWTAAHVAARQGHLEALKRLIAAGAKMQCKSETDSSSLQCAAASGSFPVFSHLLQMAACDTRVADCFGTKLVHSAAQGGCCQIMEELVKQGHSLKAVGQNGRTCLHYAARGMHLSMTRWLLEHDPEVDMADDAGETPLMTASSSSEPDLVNLLLSRGADVTAQCKTGCTALHLGVAQGSLKTVEALLQAGSDPSTTCLRGTSALHHAAEANRTENIAAVLKHADSPLVHATDEMGWSALHYAALHQLPESAALLIQAGANVDAQCESSLTALHVACRSHAVLVAILLLAAGANVDAQCDSGLTALHVACRGQAVLVATLLLAAGVDGGLQDSRGCTALHYAAQTANWGLFSLLHAHPSCRPKLSDTKGASLLQYGVEGGSLDIVKLLLSELQALGPSAGLAAHVSSASAVGDAYPPSTEEAVMKRPSEPSEDTEGDPEQTPILENGDAASPQGSQDTGSEALQGTAEHLPTRRAVSSGLCNPIHIAALKGFSDLIPSLLRAGFSASAPDAYKRTPLHYAAMKGFAFFPAHQSGTQPAAPHNHASPGSGEPHSAQASQAQSTAKAEGTDDEQQSSGGQAHAEECLSPGYSPSCSGDSEHSYSSQGSPPPSPIPEGAPQGSLMPPGVPPSYAPSYGRVGTLPHGRVGMQGVGAPPPYSTGLPSPTQYYGPRATVAYGFTADLLIEAGADADAIDMWGCSVLHYAAGTGQIELVERLLELDAECSQADKNQWTPLTYAAAGGHANCVRALLDAGASAGDVDTYGRTALHWAAERGWADVVTLLVPAMALEGRDVGLLDKAGSSAAAVAAYGGHVDCVARVLDSTAIASDRGMSALHLAVQGKMEALVAQLLMLPAAVATVNVGDKDGLTPLHWASTEGSIAMVDMLLSAGADVDALTNDHWTPLHESALNGHVVAVERLLRAGAQIGLKTSVGLTPLHNAASNGHVRAIETLICAGAAVNARAGSNATALFIAAQNGHVEAVKHLLQSSAEPSVAAGGGATALHAAASAGHLTIVEALLQANADVDIQAQNGATAMHNAAGGGFEAVVKALLAANADLDVQNTNCNTALHLAAGKGHLAVVSLLLEAGADALIRNAKGWAPAQSAAAGGHLDIVLRLVAAGACPRSKPELDVLRMLARKTSYKLSYVEGRLKLAEKERQRAMKAKEAIPEDGVSQEELAVLNAKADANMAALLQEEAALKDAQEAKKGKKKKRKGKKVDEMMLQEKSSPAGLALTDTQVSSPEESGQITGLRPDELSEEALPEVEAPSKPDMQISQKKLSTAEQAGKNVSDAQTVATKAIASPGATEATAAGASDSASLTQINDDVSAALPSKKLLKDESTKVPPSPQRNHVKGPGRRAAHGPPAGNSSNKSEWVPVPGQPDPLEHKAEWQAAGGRKAKRATGGKPTDSGTNTAQQAPEAAPAHQPKLPKPQKAGKGVQPEAQGGHSKGVDPTAKMMPAPGRSSGREEQTGPRQPSQAAAKGKASARKAGKAGAAEGKHTLPTKAARVAPVIPEQQSRSTKLAETKAPTCPAMSFADMARPARAPQAGTADLPAPAGASGGSVPAQKGRPVQSAAPQTRAVQGNHTYVASPFMPTPIPAPASQQVQSNPAQSGTPSAHTAIPAAHASITAEAAPAPGPGRPSRHRTGLPGPWQAVQGQPVQDPQAAASNRQHAQPVSSVPPSGSPAGCSSVKGPSEPVPRRPARADPVTINPMATADRLQKAPGPLRPQPLCGTLSREHSLAPSLFSSMDNGHVDWSFPRQGSYGSLSSAAHMARGRGNAAEGASEGQTFSSMESLASLTDGPENHAASHNAQPSRVPLGVSPLGKAEGAGYAAARIANGSMGYTQHLQGGLPGVPSLLHSIWNASPGWEASGQQAAHQMPSKPAQKQPSTQMSAAELERIQLLAQQYGLTCPLTKKLLRDPVMAADGYTYERSAIAQHLDWSMLSPVTHAPMPSQHLDDALAMRSRIALLIPDA